jgi:hypothetical protein
VTGTPSGGFPVTAGAFQSTFGGGGGHVFVTALNSAGSALIYSTLLGGSGTDTSTSIALDTAGNAYVSGITNSPNFPTTPGAFQPAIGSLVFFDVFVTKLNPTGSALVYSTYLGGSSEDRGNAIAVDEYGSAYVTGGTFSTNFPTTPGAFKPANPLGGGVFVTKLDPTGSTLVYSTFLSDSGDNAGNGIAVDADCNAYVTGRAGSGLATTADAFQASSAGPSPCQSPGCAVRHTGDAFVAKLNPTGSALVYSSFLGGTGDDFGAGIALDAARNVYVAGWTSSSDFPVTAGAFQSTFGGNTDAFVAKIVNVALAPSAQPGTSRSEESAASTIGYWMPYGAEIGNFSGGTIVASNVAGNSAMFNFTGTAVSWIGVKCNVCGIATVLVDGVPTTVNTGSSAGAPLASEPVFSASGLQPGVTHTLVITVMGMTNTGGTYVALDAFDVTGGTTSGPLLPPIVLPPPPVVPSLPPIL